MASKKVNIVDNTNEVSVTNSNNKIEIVNTNTPSNIEVTQRTTTLVQVNTIGPQGPVGPQGPAVSFDSGSYVTTGSFNTFTSSIQTEVDNLTSKTGSYATTGSNNFIGNQVITGSVDVKNGNINIESNSYFLQGTSTGGNNVSLIGVNNQDKIYIGNQGYDNIIAGATNIEGNTQITGSLIVSGSSTFTNIGPAIFSGSVNITSSLNLDGPFTITGSIQSPTSLTFDTTATDADAIARLKWNETEGTLDLGMGGGLATLQIGQELYYPKVVNKSGENLINGTLVMVDPAQPAQGNRLRVIRAVTDGTYPSELIVGPLTEDVDNNQEGFATWFGYVRQLNRTDLENNGVKDPNDTWVEGSILYTNPNLDGGYTSSMQSAPAGKSSIAAVTAVNGQNITLLVRPKLDTNVGNLHDVTDLTTTSSYGDLFIKSGNIWTTGKSLSGSYSLTGDLTATEFSGSFSGSYVGDGNGLTNIPASGIVGLNLSQIASGSVSASISPNNGFVVNTNIDTSGNITILGDLEADNFSTNGITRVGTESGDSNSGDLITVLGYQSGKNNTGRQIVSVGYQSSTDNSANYVSVLGYRAGYLNSGIYLSSVGYSAGRENTGANQSSLGYTAGFRNIGNNITVVGYQAGRENSGNNIVAIGHQAGYLNTLDNQFIVRHSTANSIPLIQGNFESGSIGIGLTLPQSNLHVAGDIWASGSNGHITASGNISASGIVYGTTGSFSHLQGNSPITVGDSVTFQQPITASSLTSNNNSIFLGFDENNLNNNYIYIEDGGDLFILGYGGGVEIGSGDGYQINVADIIEFTTPSQTSLTLNDLYAVFQVPITTTDVTASGNISASTFIGDGSQITGVVSSSYALTASYAENAGGGSGAGFPFEGDAVISGSLLVNAFSTTSQSLSVIGSGSTVFDVIGSVGTLFSVDDDLTGTLFSVNDISGFPILEASASGDVYIGKSPQSLYTTAIISSTTAATTHSLSSLSTSSYDGAFFEYTAHSGSNARAGNIMSTWNGGNIVYTETNTLDIGDTSDLTTEVIISGSTARLVAYGANAGYKIKTIIKAI